MSNYWYNRIKDSVYELTSGLAYFETEHDTALLELKITGLLTKEAGELPGMIAHRYNQLQELEAMLHFFTVKLKAVKGKAFKRYLEGYNKALTSRDADRYADADKDVIELELLINDIALTRNKFLGIIKGLEVKHWQLSSIVKLKIAGFDDGEMVT